MPFRWYTLWDPVWGLEKLGNLGQKVYNLTADIQSKFPKTTKTPVFVAFGLSGLVYQGSEIKRSAAELSLRTGVSYSTIDPRVLAQSQRLCELQDNLFQDDKELSKSFLSLGCDGVYQWVKLKPSLYDQYANNLGELGLSEKKLLGAFLLRLEEKKAAALSTKGSLPASDLVSKGGADSVEIPSVLECFFF